MSLVKSLLFPSLCHLTQLVVINVMYPSTYKPYCILVIFSVYSINPVLALFPS